MRDKDMKDEEMKDREMKDGEKKDREMKDEELKAEEMRDKEKLIPEEVQKRRSRKKKERRRQVLIYKAIIAAAVLLLAAVICFAVLGQRGKGGADGEETQTGQMTGAPAGGEEELTEDTRPSPEETAVSRPSSEETAAAQPPSEETEAAQPPSEEAAAVPPSSEEAEPAGRMEEALREYENPGISNVSDYLNIREEANETASIIGRLPENGVCEVLEQGEVWHRIRSGAVEGYVNGSYLLTGEEARERAEQILGTQDRLETAENESVGSFDLMP